MISEENIKDIIIIQNWYRNIVKFKIKIFKQINADLNSLYYLINSCMTQIHDNLILDIFSKNKYNSYMIKLDSIFEQYKIIAYPLNIIKIYNIKMENLLKMISNIKFELIELCKDCGMSCINDIIKLIANTDIIFNDDTTYRLLKFYNNNFVPISCDIYTTNGSPKFNNIVNTSLEEIKNSENTDQLIEFVKKSITSNIQQNMFNHDKIIIKDLKFPVCSQLYFKPSSLIESIQGARLYIPIEQENIILCMNGFFREDPLNITRVGGTFGVKNTQIIKLLNNISNIPENFKFAFLEQLLLRDFVVLSNSDIIKKCNDSFDELVKLKSKTISNLVKDFLTSDVERQRFILTLFLLTDNDTDTQYLAYLMYDMISSESYLLKPQPLAEQVYNSLHWSVQKLFKIAIKKVNKYSQKLLEFNESEIPYEKRICLMKANDSIKSKAMEKYKEVQSKSGDSAAKAQQYLDAILKIPFGFYKKENILNYFNIFENKFISYINNSLNSKIKNKYIDLLNSLDINNIKVTTVDSFFYKYNNLLNENNFNENNFNENYLKVNELKEMLKKLKLSVNGNKIMLNNRLNNYYKSLNNTESNDEYNKLYIEWSDYKIQKKEYMKSIRDNLNKSVYGHDEAKLQVERIIGQWINGEMKGYCFGFEGPPGTGKTSFAKKGLTRCLLDNNNNPRPFSFIALGGSSNGSTLDGHSYTYVGSTWGRIVDILMDSKCMNPIIFIDELDKVSRTEHGKEIIGILTHLTDSTQNDEFSDKYFAGIKIDLSKALIIFSYNDPELIDNILLDRIHRVKFKNLNTFDKINVANNHLLPEIYKTVGIDKNCININDDILEYIINTYTFEAGARKLKEKLFEIIREINLRYLMDDTAFTFPINIDKDFIECLFSNKPKIQIKKITKEPRIGLVNGLYATSAGVGGLTIIETYKTPSDSFLSLVLTGQQGDVMQESVKCAKTIAWNLIPVDKQQDIKKNIDKLNTFGLHIHCPEAATPKDGPSAGAAMTLCVLSVLLDIPVKNNVAMTGEIDLNGSVHAIGGLDSKIEGAKRAGANLVLCPSQNENDLIKIRESEHPVENDNFKVIMVDNIWDVIEHALTETDIKFKKYIYPHEL